MKKPEKPTPRLEDVELYPDAMERLERAIKTAVRHGPVPRAAIKGKPRKPTKPRSSRRP